MLATAFLHLGYTAIPLSHFNICSFCHVCCFSLLK